MRAQLVAHGSHNRRRAIRPNDETDMKTVTAALLYLGIFAGIPLAVIVVLFFLPVLNIVDPTALGILVVLSVIMVALWLFVPHVTAVPRKRSARAQKASIKRSSSPTVEAIEELGGEATRPKSRKARSKLPVLEESERHEPFVDVVEKSTQHPASQPSVRRKARAKTRKKAPQKKAR